MAPSSSNYFLFIIISFICPLLLLTSAGTLTLTPTKTYIIHVAPPPSLLLTSETWHLSFFPNSYPTSLLYSYKHAASAFAARFTNDELAVVKAKPGFLRADADFIVPLATTHTPEFLGLSRSHQPAGGLWNDSDFGRGVIVAVLDTGVLPNHPSFDASGMPPPPAKWKGKCEFNVSDACNNKLIGARAFLQGIQARHK
ncbi:Subtilisin-like protease SDD1 [Platanthera guangdongensis]|uniref:Subtilisin-like protease SDD1 n=1 Tax=Platanthera guangdongensis TaxID=2320717 RepID=A0ABR2N5Z5_9ASPA